ncbi:MAG: acetoacetate--CoA ligase [Myxococcaceae bacterium]|nr:acetoacetate--CoA ligase [Myxococcaceae bacterium]
MTNSNALEPGSLLWTPPDSAGTDTVLGRYMDWLCEREEREFADYQSLWQWSVQELPRFWESIAAYFEVHFHAPAHATLAPRHMPGARFFPGATLNYAEHALRRLGAQTAVIYRMEAAAPRTLSWDELRDAVARARAGLVRLGVARGDRVAALLPNCPEALIAFLATASLGATWSSCSPEFGAESVLDRFGQIAPKVLLAVDGYRHAGKLYDRRELVERVREALPSLMATVIVGRLGQPLASGCISFADLTVEHQPLSFESCPFDHPLWILYSSGTTGLPKAIVHGHGGILLEHLKAHALHGDLGPDSRFFWFTTTGWMMWNYLVGGLLVGATVSLYEGHPSFPDAEALFRYAAEDRISYFGISAPFLVACAKQGLSPCQRYDFTALRTVGSTGAPLPVSGFAWVYKHLKREVLLGSVSGGTDVCSAFLLSCPLLPVHAGELQCAALGVAVASFDAEGHPRIGEVGELVITEPMPSMPTGFLDDADGERYRASYFADYPGIWRHGDFIELNERGGAVIYGRSDATLNRGGVRMGTAELYRVVEALPEVTDSLVVDTSALDQADCMWLFVVLEKGCMLTDALAQRIQEAVRSGVSPRHVPDRVVAVPEIPRTLNGKKLEVPVKRLLMGLARECAVAPGTLSNPEALDALLAAARV